MRYYSSFRRAIPHLRVDSYVLLTRLPLLSPQVVRGARLACLRHTASVHPEPGSNSPRFKDTLLLKKAKVNFHTGPSCTTAWIFVFTKLHKVVWKVNWLYLLPPLWVFSKSIGTKIHWREELISQIRAVGQIAYLLHACAEVRNLRLS